MWKKWKRRGGLCWRSRCFAHATSIGASRREAQHAESRADFIHKCKVAAKEAEETEYWLLLCQHAPAYPTPAAAVFDPLQQVRRLLARIILSSKQHGT